VLSSTPAKQASWRTRGGGEVISGGGMRAQAGGQHAGRSGGLQWWHARCALVGSMRMVRRGNRRVHVGGEHEAGRGSPHDGACATGKSNT
jgi:hypothetical protein